MVTGPLRVILWILGSIGALWLIVGLTSLPYMGRMMGGDASMDGMDGMDGGMMGGEGMLGMISMMGTMALQLIGMLGLVGIFIYLVIDAVRRRRSAT